MGPWHASLTNQNYKQCKWKKKMKPNQDMTYFRNPPTFPLLGHGNSVQHIDSTIKKVGNIFSTKALVNEII